ncbi:hypothetical protein [Yersinia ruckeri]|uniref:hypothetical protein n=1 Tax=Yersinia ruckeri TaxID=29486 RepID=UPI0008FE7858|nr:hypothetical protein [Yersinia ruckeri]EKN4696361.1 hypothetical protein [Yersinia ruckeri]MCK8543178.1 hypothetical protein [Yersinia ruckeri]MCK8552787.1 hypothetical protein [Yersinia ruckeri]MCW6519783.1 hypothetical protein [Yersinia ruckeri]MCW6525366.1 hypothetical protein [Yersinia ruckeri]
MEYLVSFKDYAWVLSFVSLICIFVGWGVVYRNAKRLATRSESKTAIDNLIKVVNEISDIGITYWLSTGASHMSSHHYEMTIMSKISQSFEFMKVLAGRGVKLDDKFLADLSEKTTLNCEKVTIMSADSRTEKSQLILGVAMGFISHSFELFEKKYPPNMEQTLDEFLLSLDSLPS